MKQHKCYANCIGECSDKMSQEHYISEKILNLLMGELCYVTGMPWQKEKKFLAKKALTANVLCVKHNNQLSKLDNAGGSFFETIYTCTRGGIQGSISTEHLKFEHNGRDIQKWMLKLACGAIASGIWGGHHRNVPYEWVKILFDFKKWPPFFNLSYIHQRITYTVPEKDHMKIDFIRDLSNENLWGVSLVFMPLEITLFFNDTIDNPENRHPKVIGFENEKKKLEIKIKW
ncbi:hypothetical protein HZA38_05690 [Candidatus Peregrinibacteria bacterium]|nr:hypothetical protein [Candidatus Peregrinibacteria bacterium]